MYEGAQRLGGFAGFFLSRWRVRLAISATRRAEASEAFASLEFFAGGKTLQNAAPGDLRVFGVNYRV